MKVQILLTTDNFSSCQFCAKPQAEILTTEIQLPAEQLQQMFKAYVVIM